MQRNFIWFTVVLSCLVAFPLKAQLIDLDQIETDSVVDNEGNVYPTVRIGDTWWMASNLRTKHYNDGTEILQMTEVIDASESDENNTWEYWTMVDRWAYPNFDSESIETYGLLYTWSAYANTSHGGICPEGWLLTDTADWFNLGRLIVGADNVIWDEGIRNTPQGGTETYYEVSSIKKVGRFLKSDNGVLWTLEPTISTACNAAGMNIVPAGKICYTVNGFGTLADFWTTCYVHSDSTGQGRRYIHFQNDNHTMALSWNFNGNVQCARCIKMADTASYFIEIDQPLHGSISVIADDAAVASGDRIESGTVLNISAEAYSGYVLYSIVVNGVKPAALEYTLIEDVVISAVFSETSAINNRVQLKDVEVYSNEGNIYVEMPVGGNIQIYTLSGIFVDSKITPYGGLYSFAVKQKGMYIVKVTASSSSRIIKCVL